MWEIISYLNYIFFEMLCTFLFLTFTNLVAHFFADKYAMKYNCGTFVRLNWLITKGWAYQVMGVYYVGNINKLHHEPLRQRRWAVTSGGNTIIVSSLLKKQIKYVLTMLSHYNFSCICNCCPNAWKKFKFHIADTDCFPFLFMWLAYVSRLICVNFSCQNKLSVRQLFNVQIFLLCLFQTHSFFINMLKYWNQSVYISVYELFVLL
jgi:hypothetical protein